MRSELRPQRYTVNWRPKRGSRKSLLRDRPTVTASPPVTCRSAESTHYGARANRDGVPMSKPIRERFAALSLGELHRLAEENRDNETVTRLLWEIRALHDVAYHAWRVEAEQHFVYPNNPLGAALFDLRRLLQQERWLSEMIVKIKGQRPPGDDW